jgi:hypothetical protein
VFFGKKVRQKETYICGGQYFVWLLRGNTHGVGGQSSGLGLRGDTEIVLITCRSVYYIKYDLYDSYYSEDTVV